jgi:hypothetical protein
VGEWAHSCGTGMGSSGRRLGENLTGGSHLSVRKGKRKEREGVPRARPIGPVCLPGSAWLGSLTPFFV